MKNYTQEYGLTAREIVENAVYELVTFTYNSLAQYLYRKGYQIKLETIKRVVRRLKEEGIIAECGRTRKKAIVWCLTTHAVSVARGGKELVRGW